MVADSQACPLLCKTATLYANFWSKWNEKGFPDLASISLSGPWSRATEILWHHSFAHISNLTIFLALCFLRCVTTSCNASVKKDGHHQPVTARRQLPVSAVWPHIGYCHLLAEVSCFNSTETALTCTGCQTVSLQILHIFANPLWFLRIFKLLKLVWMTRASYFSF